MRRPGLSAAAKTVYAALSTYADRAGWIWVRQETIASDLERSRGWVHAAIAELEGQGIVQHDRQYIEGRQRASRYRLRDGLPREASAAVSEKSDSAVQSADTSHYDESKDSLSREEGESSRQKPADREPAAHVPADWVPTAADIAWATARHPSLDVLAFTEAFVLSCRAKGYRYSDVSAAWRRWLVEPKAKLPTVKPPASRTHSSNRFNQDQEQRHDDSRPHPGYRGFSPAPEPRLSATDLAKLNADRAADCLERIMGRRAAATSS